MLGVPLQILLAAAVLLPFGGSAHRRTEEGNRLYLDGAFDDALRAYTEAQLAQPEAPELYYDIGNVLYRQGDFEGAAEAYTRALLAAPDGLVGPAAHNLGNSRYELQEFEDAVSAYERALRADPSDEGAKHNLELALQALEQQSPPQQSQESPDEGEGQQEQEQDPQQGQQETEPQEDGSQDQQQSQAGDQEDSGGEQQAPDNPPDGQMTEEQAERMLDGLSEQEAESLRDRVLQKKPAAAKAPEKDW
jgi:Ca-activated chloride channel family protein